MIEIKNGTKKYRGKSVLDNINMSFVEGKIYGILGRNCSGKTLIMKAICGYIALDKGDVLQMVKK
ncbi:ATP-binding cassette domain-containing protein [Gemella sp. GH3]|uniref:ATP-binding cassette domain-containing protein n=1 Tax=unclassified Gemella TaxID=2624949 RepID=UPI0015D08453|nr:MULTISPECIES: ATP-binding cassette domain-containing protein [unclassified Gemella]MBF0713497.1 ATP-binding cassette domain-containing protein [Gemella sp. GH3.1]NYS50449.1 ATP-binding cassette domain-containing protein [Gemella sp. GH3]